MKKKLGFLFLCSFLIGLGGCHADTRPAPRIVSAVTVDWYSDGTRLSRYYTDTEKMEALLLYLRLIKTEVPEDDPTVNTGNTFTITVHLTNGRKHTCQQKLHRYFRWEQMPWQTISPEQATQLYTLLQQQKSDI